MNRFLSFKVKTWESILLVLIVLLSSLVLVEANRKDAITTPAIADYNPAPYTLNPDVKKVVLSLTAIEFGQDQVDAMDQLITHESNFNPNALNKSSGACGIFQNINCNYKSMDLTDQIQWGFNYIKVRYGNPQTAWLFWQTPHLINGKWVNYY